MRRSFKIIMAVLLSGLCGVSCTSSVKNKKDSPGTHSGKIVIHFVHYIDGQPAKYDTLMYKNKVGNQYEVDQVQYFISQVTLHKSDGHRVLLSPKSPWHYVDKDIPKTLTWNLPNDIKPGTYDSISFVFGIADKINTSFMFRNPPQNNMTWPGVLGGGYHYMKMNLKYLNTEGQLSNFDCHLGRGQQRNPNGKITGFIPNNFRVSLSSTFVIKSKKTKDIQLIMNIGKWFNAPHKIDFNNYGGIMENEKAMKSFCENGKHAFTLKISE